MNKMNRLIVKTLMIMRQKNLLVILCLPNFHLLDSYVKYHRVRTLIQIRERGYYVGYQGFGIKKIARDGTKYKTILGIRVPTNSFWEGYFRKAFPLNVDDNEYKTIKAQHIKEFLEKATTPEIEGSQYMKIIEIARKFNVSRSTVRQKVVDGEIPSNKFGQSYRVHKDDAQNYFEKN